MKLFKPKLDLFYSPTLFDFYQDYSPIKIIRGPVGSGKSSVCCFDIMKVALNQEPSPNDGVRYHRAAIVRNTYGQLKTTTIKTWLEYFPERECGKIIYSAPIFHHIKIPGHLDLEVYFIALDRPADVGKLLSFELSSVFFNELREAQEEVVIRAWDRVGRYPKLNPNLQGVECTHPVLIGDTNPPDEDHWLYDWEMNGKELLDKKLNKISLKFYNQPAAVLDVTDSNDKPSGVISEDNPGGIINAAGRQYIVNPKAENIPNLFTNFYATKLGLNSREDIRVYYESKYGVIGSGKPVIPEYDDTRMAVDDLPVLPNAPLMVGMDIGGGTLSPAAVIGQVHPSTGAILIHAEISCFEMALEDFSRMYLQLIATRFPGRKIDVGLGDPAGLQRDPIQAVTIFDHLKGKGIPMRGAPTNDISTRIQITRAPMLRLTHDGKPGFMIDKRCVALRGALMGKWVYRRVQMAGVARFADKPDKGKYSHLGDALAYFMFGTGEYEAILGRQKRANRKPIQAKTGFDPFK